MVDSEVQDVLNDIGRALGIYDDDDQEQEPCEIENVLDEIARLKADAAKDAEMIERLAQLVVDVYSGETSKTPAYVELARLGVHSINGTWERVRK